MKKLILSTILIGLLIGLFFINRASISSDIRTAGAGTGAATHIASTTSESAATAKGFTGTRGAVSFTGTGLDDMTISGVFDGKSNTNMRVRILNGDPTNPNTFIVSYDGGSTWHTATTNITGAAQKIGYGLYVTFGSTTGHVTNDRWDWIENAYTANEIVASDSAGTPKVSMNQDRSITWFDPYGNAQAKISKDPSSPLNDRILEIYPSIAGGGTDAVRFMSGSLLYNAIATDGVFSLIKSYSLPMSITPAYTGTTYPQITLGKQGGEGWAPTSGTAITASIGDNAYGNAIFNPTSGAAKYIGFQVAPTINQTGTATGDYTAFQVNVTETAATGTNKLLMDLQVGGTSRITVKNDGTIIVTFATGVDAEIGRGTTDTDITYMALRNADGELCYVFPNADQNAIVVQAGKP